MSEKVEPEEWIIESFVGNIGWSLSRLNETPDPHTLQWCMDQWNRFKAGEMADYPFEEHMPFASPELYRLRNVVTEDIIMGAIL